MALDNLFEGLQPQAGARVVNNGLDTTWESLTQATPSTSSQEDYMNSLFAPIEKKVDWRTAPPEEQKPEGFMESAKGMIKDLASAVTVAPQALYDWGEGFFTNKQTNKGITNLSEFQSKMGQATSDMERAQVQQEMLKQGVITTDYFNQKQSDTDIKQQEKQQYYIQATSGFKDELTEAVKPYLNQADKMQQKYILAAIDSQVNQYGKSWSAINDSYQGSDFNKADYFNKLNTVIVGGIKDTVVNFSKKIMEGKDSQQAYDELVPTMKDTFSNIAQFGLDVADKSTKASIEHFYGDVSLTKPLAALGLVSLYVQQATQDYITKPFEYGKQALLSDYDVVEDMQKLGVYKDSASVFEKAGATFSKIGGNIVSGIPQIVPMLGIMYAELAIGNIPALAMLTKGSKIRTGLGELAKDSLIYNGMAQASLGRGLTEADMAQNFVFDGPIDATLGLMEKPMKAELDKTWMNKFGKDYGFAPTDTVSADVLSMMNKGNSDAAMAQHLADVSSGKQGDVLISSLDPSTQMQIGSMQDNIAKAVDNVSTNTQTLREGNLVDSSAKVVLENKSPSDVVDYTNIQNKIINNIETNLSNPDSDLSKKQTLSSISSMIQKGTISPNEVNTMLDSIKKDLAGVRIGNYKATNDTVNNTVEFAKKLYLNDESVPVSAIDTPVKLQLFHIVQNELYKNIAIAKSSAPGTDIGRYVISDNGMYVDKVTRKELDEGSLFANLDTIKGKVDISHAQNIYTNLQSKTEQGSYTDIFGLQDLIKDKNLDGYTSDFVVKTVLNATMIGAKRQDPAIVAGRVKNIIDGNLNLYKLTTNDLALMRILILPGIIAKGKTTVKDIVKDNAWNLWDKDGVMKVKNANQTQVNKLVKNVVKDGSVSDITQVVGDIVGVDKNITHINESVNFDKALKKSTDSIDNKYLSGIVYDSVSSSMMKETGDVVSEARVLHEIVDTIADDKVLAKAIVDTEDAIRDEFTNGIVRGIITNKARKIKVLSLPSEDMSLMKENIGGFIIGNATIAPMSINTFQDQIEAITSILDANGIKDKAFINKVVDSIGAIPTATGILSFDKIEQLTLAAIGKLISWSSSDIKVKTQIIGDIKNGLPKDIDNFVKEITDIKSTVSDPMDMYRQILRKNLEYKDKIYGYVLKGQGGLYLNNLYRLIQTASDVRFLTATVKVDEFMETVKSNLISITGQDIRNITYKSYNDHQFKERTYMVGDTIYNYKLGFDKAYVKNTKAPPYTISDDIRLMDQEDVYIVTNNTGAFQIANPIRVSGLSSAYKFITMNELLSGSYETGHPIFLSKRMANRMMFNDGDKLTIVGKFDTERVLQHIVSNKDVKVFDVDIYELGKEFIIQPGDQKAANTLFKIKTKESDIVYDNAIKQLQTGASTDMISGYTTKMAQILNQNLQKLEYIAGLSGKVPTDIKFKHFFKQFGVDENSGIQIRDVVDNMFNELYQYGTLYRGVIKDTIKDIKKDTLVPLKSIATSYTLKKEYNDFLYSLKSNPDITVGDSNIIDLFNQILKDNDGDITESFTSLYSKMIKEGIELGDIREGITELLKIYGFDNTLPAYIHNVLFPSIDVFRGQQVADAILSTIAGKDKQKLVDAFNSKIEGQLKLFNKTHFGTDIHMIKFIESLQKMGYISTEVNIYKASTMLGEMGDNVKRNLKQIYNGDVIRLIDDADVDSLVSQQYQAIKSTISKLVDTINLGEKFKVVQEPIPEIEGISKQELSSIEEQRLMEEDMGDVEFISKGLSAQKDIDVSGIVLDYKQNIDSLIKEQSEILSLKGNYGNSGNRDIVWSDIPTYKIAGFASDNKEGIINRLGSKLREAKTRSVDDLFFTHAIRTGTSQTMAADDIFNALTGSATRNKMNSAADAYNILAQAETVTEEKFLKELQPTFTFNTGTVLKMNGESKLESANFVTEVLNNIKLIQDKMALAENKLDQMSIDHTIFTMETKDGHKMEVNSDGLHEFPVWKGYLNRLYKNNPEFFDEPINEMFVFKQLEQLNKFMNNVLATIGAKLDRQDLLPGRNVQLDTYRNLQSSIQKVIDNYSKQLGIARTGFEQTMFETKSYAGAIENMLRDKGGLGKILTGSSQRELKNISDIEVLGYTPIIRLKENGIDLGVEKIDRIIPVEKISDYLENMAGRFANTEIHPKDFGIENMGFDMRLTRKDGKIFDVRIEPDLDPIIKEVKLIGDTYTPNKEPIQDINNMMDTSTAKEFQANMDTFTCDN